MVRGSAATAMMVLVVFSAHAAGNQRQLSCSGSLIEPTALAASPKSVKLTLGPGQEAALDVGRGNNDVRVVSDNKIQLKFEADDYTGEYFHYTGDLFLIYKSGHLARLMCKP